MQRRTVMKTRPLPFYIRRKIRHRFAQNRFLDPKEFVKFLKEHDIDVNVQRLEKFEKEGWLRPAFRLVFTKELQESSLTLDLQMLNTFYRAKLMEFPREGDYEPWANFKPDYQKGERHGRKQMYYHPFQIMQVLTIIRFKKFSFYWDSDTSDDAQSLVYNIRVMVQNKAKAFNNEMKQIENIVGFLMVLEEPYRFYAFGDMTTDLLRLKNIVDLWHRWKTKKFSAQKLVQEYGINEVDVRNLYQKIASDAYRIDPLAKWYDLTRIMGHYRINELRGKPLTAQFYYRVSRLISYLYYELTKNTLNEPNELFDARRGQWKKRIYSDPFDYGTKKTQRGIIRFFILDPTVRIFLLVEGDTEEKIIEKIFGKLGISMQDDGINVLNCKGIGNMTKSRLDQIIEIANRNEISVYVLADNEGNSIQKAKKIKEEVHTNFNFHIWKKSFEEDNFGRRKVIALFNSYLSTHNKSITDSEITEQQQNGLALLRAIEKAYRKKYHEDVWRVIQITKPDISFELFAPRLKKISSRRRSGKLSEIETILDEVFKMIPTWQ